MISCPDLLLFNTPEPLGFRNGFPAAVGLSEKRDSVPSAKFGSALDNTLVEASLAGLAMAYPIFGELCVRLKLLFLPGDYFFPVVVLSILILRLLNWALPELNSLFSGTSISP